jgi:hypothetical protein
MALILAAASVMADADLARYYASEAKEAAEKSARR